ncbi:aminotransferase class I/II-fold pyridoxal phosphate-dependent enzyme, partial [uncultured Bacteroides sp.]
MDKTIYLCLAHMSEEGIEQKYVKEAFDMNWVVPLGPNVNAFEEDLKRFVGEGKEVVALSAGTAAVHLALLACGVGQGDEVIVQSFTFCASSHPVTYLGAVPVFVDSEKETWNMSPELLEEAIKDRIAKTGKKPKAIVPVALYGMPYDCTRIMEIADRYAIPVVEDAAEGFGSRFKGQVLGTFGKFGVLSFNGNKMITTSGGGALICKDAESKNQIMWYATQAREAYPYYQHETIGYNYRMSNICAGIGRGQMTVADKHIAHHRHVQALYRELLKDVEGVLLHEAPSADYDSNFWLSTITLDSSLRIKGQENAYKDVVRTAVGGAAGVIHAVDCATTDCQPNENVEALRAFMLDKKIEARPVWKPMHKQPVYKDAPAYINGVSEAIFKIGMCLPAGPWVTDEDVYYIV